VTFVYRAILKPVYFLNLISVDAPLVVVFWYWALSEAYDHAPQPTISWLLFSSAWIVYALDRLIESETDLKRERHRFHQRHIREFISFIVVIIFINGFLTLQLQLPKGMYLGAVALAITSGIYILQPKLPFSDHQREWIKNLLVTVVFASGSILPVWVSLAAESSLPKGFGWDMASMYLLTLASLRAIEGAENPRRGFPSITVWISIIFLTLLLFLNPSDLKWIWWSSSILTQLALSYAKNIQLPGGIFDFLLLLPAVVYLCLTRI